jgi:hypothetical protein
LNRIRSLEDIVKGLRSTVRASLACADLANKDYSHRECLEQGLAALLHLFWGESTSIFFAQLKSCPVRGVMARRIRTPPI